MELRKAGEQGDSPLFASAGGGRRRFSLSLRALLLIFLAQNCASQRQANKANAASFILSLFCACRLSNNFYCLGRAAGIAIRAQVRKFMLREIKRERSTHVTFCRSPFCHVVYLIQSLLHHCGAALRVAVQRMRHPLFITLLFQVVLKWQRSLNKLQSSFTAFLNREQGQNHFISERL